MDYFLANPHILGRQPKRNLADMLQREGIRVPERYDSLADARRSGKPIFVRSEHPQDYAGVSGMLHSFNLSELDKLEHITTDAALLQQGVARVTTSSNPHTKSNFHHYCRLLGHDEEQEKNFVSFSLWEKLMGISHNMFADPAIEGKYHIFSYRYESPLVLDYAQIHDGKLVKRIDIRNGKLAERHVHGLIELYERIRSLPYFAKNDCPIIEAHTVNGAHFFLQYHPVFRRNVATHVLQQPASGDFLADFVIGATPPEGIIVDTALVRYISFEDYSLTDNDVAAFTNPFENKMYGELMIPKRKVQFCVAEDDEFMTYRKFFSIHGSVSRLAKPQMSVLLNGEVRELLMKHPLVRKTQKEDGHFISMIKLKVLSDGNTATVSVAEQE